MRIGTPKELFDGEARVAMTPDSAVQLQKLGYDCVIERGAGAAARFSDADYKAVGVEVVKTGAALYKAADIIAKVRPPEDVEIRRLQKGQYGRGPSHSQHWLTRYAPGRPGRREKGMDWIRGSANPGCPKESMKGHR